LVALVELGDRNKRSMLCWVWIIIPFMPNIMSKVYWLWLDVARPTVGDLLLLAGGVKGLIPETPIKTLRLLGAKERLAKLVI
jgi:hypothetical protein